LEFPVVDNPSVTDAEKVILLSHIRYITEIYTSPKKNRVMNIMKQHNRKQGFHG
jgi:hypothetical protein